MKKLFLIIFALIVCISLYGQCKFNGVPSLVPDTSRGDCETALDVSTGTFYVWNRNTTTWVNVATGGAGSGSDECVLRIYQASHGFADSTYTAAYYNTNSTFANFGDLEVGDKSVAGIVVDSVHQDSFDLLICGFYPDTYSNPSGEYFQNNEAANGLSTTADSSYLRVMQDFGATIQAFPPTALAVVNDTIANLAGTGAPLYKGKNGGQYEFKRITSTDGSAVIANQVDSIDISVNLITDGDKEDIIVNNGGDLLTIDSNAVVAGASDANLFNLDGDNNRIGIGVGTTVAGAKLNVSGNLMLNDNLSAIYFDGSTTAAQIVESSNGIRIGTSNTSHNIHHFGARSAFYKDIDFNENQTSGIDVTIKGVNIDDVLQSYDDHISFGGGMAMDGEILTGGSTLPGDLSHRVVLIDNNSASSEYDLLAASAQRGLTITFILIDATNPATIDADGSDTITESGSTGNATISLSTVGESKTLWSDGTSTWYVIYAN